MFEITVIQKVTTETKLKRTQWMNKRKKNTQNSKGVSYSNLAQTKAHRFV